MELNEKQRKILQDLDSSRERGFSEFLAMPQNKLLISLIPQTSPPELLTTLLRAAFECGHGTASVSMSIQLMQAMVKKSED